MISPSLTKEPQTFHTIRFNDCDPFGHLNNARYIDYIITAREDHLSQFYGINNADYVQEGVSWVVNHHEILYLKPARYYEKVCIQTSLIEFTEHYVLVEGIMFDEQQQVVKAVQWTKFFHINLSTSRKAQHTDQLMELFAGLLNEKVDGKAGIKSRVAQLLGK